MKHEEVKDGQCVGKLVRQCDGPVPQRHPGSMKETALSSQGTYEPLPRRFQAVLSVWGWA